MDPLNQVPLDAALNPEPDGLDQLVDGSGMVCL